MRQQAHRLECGFLALTLVAGCTQVAYVPSDSSRLADTARLPAVYECVQGTLRADSVRQSVPSSSEWTRVVARDRRSTRLNAGGTLAFAGVVTLIAGTIVVMTADNHSDPAAFIDLGPALHRAGGATLLLSGAALLTNGSILFARGRRTPPAFEAGSMPDLENVAPPPGCNAYVPYEPTHRLH